MKLAYKVSLPLVVIITALIWFVTTTSNKTQREIITQGQIQTEIKITNQFEKNKQNMIAVRKGEVEFIADLVADISIQHLYDMTFEKLKQPLRKFMEFEAITAIRVVEAIENKEVAFFGIIEEGNEKITKKIIWKNDGEFLGTVEIYYDNSEMINDIGMLKKELVDNIHQSNEKQNSYIESVIQKQNYSNIAITLVILFTILTIVYRLVINPLTKLKKGLDSFFDFLQNKTSEIEPIDIRSNDEFSNMSDSLNDNIKITTELHKQIHELNTNLEQKVLERTLEIEEKSKKITELLDNAAEGFLSFGKALLVDSEYSKECEKIFSKAIVNQNIADLFYENDSDEKELFVKVMNDIFDLNIAKKKKRVFLNLLRDEFIVNDKSIKVEYKHIDDKKMMLVLTDITEKKALEQKVEIEKKTLKMVVSVVGNISEFKEMTEEYHDFCKHKDSYIKDEKNFVNNIVEFYRKIHTFKGNFAQKDMIYIVSKLHHFENSLSEMLKSPERNFSKFKALVEGTDIVSWLDEDINILEDILDEKFLEQKDALEISKPIIDSIEGKILQLLKFPKNERNVTYEEILGDVTKIKKRSIKEYLSSYPKLLEQLSMRLNKPLYPVKIIGADEIFVDEEFKPFAKTLVHVFRNSIDHGIESLDKREANGKDETATIECIVREFDKEFYLEIIDDGCGIDENIIKQKALEKDIYTKEKLDSMSKEEILLIIFADAFSTKSEATELSGRGIGLGAVKSECERLGGKIEILTSLGKGTTFRFIFPK